jgi:death-on-curing protein
LPRFLTKRVVLAFHRDLIESFGGVPGIRDEHALDSAMAQARATFEGQMLHRTVAEQAAAYLFHLVRNHPFVDGNKRVGFAAMDTFMRINGHRLEASDEEAFSLVMAVAVGEISKEELIRTLARRIAHD